MAKLTIMIELQTNSNELFFMKFVFYSYICFFKLKKEKKVDCSVYCSIGSKKYRNM